MPYKSIKSLPSSVKNNLPTHAQEIYQAAFNHAWDEYKDPVKRAENTSQEETTHKVAWAAVKKKYTKKNNEWTSKT